MWVARDKDGTLFLYKKKPEKNLEFGLWEVASGIDYCEIHCSDRWMFPTVKWEDKEPTEIKLIRK